MARFRKKPVEIEAVQLTDALLDAEHPCADHWPGILYDPRPGERCALIHTLEGTMRADLGDWIIRGVKGEVYPCKPDIFAATYEPVTDTAAPSPVGGAATLEAPCQYCGARLSARPHFPWCDRPDPAAPAPTAGDAVTQECVLRECWYDLVEKDDRTSPEEYPDHALITREELGIYLQEAAQAERAALLEKIREPSEHMLRVGEQQQEGVVIAGRKLALKIWRAMIAAHLSGDQP